MTSSIPRFTFGAAGRAGAAFALLGLLAGPEAQGQLVVPCVSFCGSTVQIIGCDERTQGPTTTAAALTPYGPWRHVGRLDGGGSGGCTGTLIGPRHVLTAAHCVIGANDQFKNGSIRFRLAQFQSNECGRPYGTHYAVRVFAPDAYVGGDLSPENKAWDYAIVELANPIPEAVPMAFDYRPWNTIQDLTSYSIGYPGDKDLPGTVWQTGSSNDFLDSPYKFLEYGDRGLLYVTNDSAGGQSGSPVYVYEAGQRTVVGVFIGSPPDGSECFLGRSWASRLTPGAVERIENAMLYPYTLDFSLRWRNIPPDQVLPDEPAPVCN